MTICVLAAAAGCSSATPSAFSSAVSSPASPTTTGTAVGGPSSTAQPSGQASGQPTGQTPPSSSVRLAFADNGKTITLHVGGTVHIALNSAFWTFQPIAAPQPLKLDATAYVSPSPGTCTGPQAAGSGCGTQTADYTAVTTGTTSVVATRVNCGEAMRCTDANGHFQVQVVIVH